ncbi:MAG: hypothetical protein EPO12_16045 [Aquabacterium sp.]|jgi:hypothetical protein|nr:MAG: hypothetical protein EPO12_16045 [Aquabacterium sp.]
MPFTPFHMGPGLAFKAVGGARFSVLVFGVAQVAMDIEPLVGILRGWPVLHGWTHTYAGATLIGLLVWLLAPWPCRRLLAGWNALLEGMGLKGWRSPGRITQACAAAGAFVGTWSHVLLDSVMHGDMHPLRPFAEGNALLHAVSLTSLHLLCVAALVVGLLAWLAAGWLHKDRA